MAVYLYRKDRIPGHEPITADVIKTQTQND